MDKKSFVYNNKYVEEKNLFRKALSIIRRDGIFHLVYDLFDLIYHYAMPRKVFYYNNKKYKTFVHWYNPTWRGEREVEIPIAKDLISNFKGKNILEIGHVLNYYIPFKHEIVDKYEVAPGVINEDVVTFNPGKKYDHIISISTIEHVGWEEKPKKPEKVLAALKNLKKILKKDGTLFFTAPFGYNLYLDKVVIENKIGFSKRSLLVKEGNNWKQIPFSDYKRVLENKHMYKIIILFADITN